MTELPASISQLFVNAGWKPALDKKECAEHSKSSIDHAKTLLIEYAGLKVGSVEPGLDCSRNDIHFFNTLRPEVDSIIQPWLPKVGTLTAFAYAHYNYMLVFVDNAGKFYFYTDPDENLYFGGSSFGEAMERLLLGIRCGPLIEK